MGADEPAPPVTSAFSSGSPERLQSAFARPDAVPFLPSVFTLCPPLRRVFEDGHANAT